MRLNDLRTGKAVSTGDLTVEHVLPKKLSAGSPWRPWFPIPEVRERCTDSLGNLVLVTKEQNDKGEQSRILSQASTSTSIRQAHRS